MERSDAGFRVVQGALRRGAPKLKTLSLSEELLHARHRHLAPLAKPMRVLTIDDHNGAMPRRAHLTDLEITVPFWWHDALAAFADTGDEDRRFAAAGVLDDHMHEVHGLAAVVALDDPDAASAIRNQRHQIVSSV